MSSLPITIVLFPPPPPPPTTTTTIITRINLRNVVSTRAGREQHELRCDSSCVMSSRKVKASRRRDGALVTDVTHKCDGK